MFLGVIDLDLQGQIHFKIKIYPIFTRGQFWPSGIVVACVCVCVYVCVSVCPSIMSLSVQ